MCKSKIRTLSKPKYVKSGGFFTSSRYFDDTAEVIGQAGYYGSCISPTYTIRLKSGEIVEGVENLRNKGDITSGGGIF